MWFYDDGRLWFDDWVRRGESSFGPYNGEALSVSPSFEKGLDGKVKRIFFDVDEYYYYEYLRDN